MNKILTILLLFNLSNISICQIIDSNWFYTEGEKTCLSTFALIPNTQDFSFPIEGMDKTWDFSNALDDGSENFSYVSLGNFALIDSFPSATVGSISQIGDITRYTFYQVNGDTLFDLGFSEVSETGDEVLQINQHPIIRLVPLTFDESFDGEYNSDYYINGEINDTLFYR